MIRVLIERWLVEHAGAAPYDAFREIRHEAIKKPGYISGETLRDVEDPCHYVIVSSWQSREDWDAWASSEERLRADRRFSAMLVKPEKITVLEPA